MFPYFYRVCYIQIFSVFTVAASSVIPLLEQTKWHHVWCHMKVTAHDTNFGIIRQGQKRSWYIDAPTPAGVFLSLGFLCGCLCTGSKAAFSSPIKWVFVNTHRDNFQEKVMICTILRLRKAPFIYHFFFTHIRCPFSMAINSRQEVKRDKKQDEKR